MLSGLIDNTAAQLYALCLSLRCQPVVLELQNAARNYQFALSRRILLVLR
jgi:hypothetical protein